MFQPNPPTPRAMPDAQLNEKIAELQLQPDGLVAAMALIEEQSKLRQEDALEYSRWQLEVQMQAVSEPATEQLSDPAQPQSHTDLEAKEPSTEQLDRFEEQVADILASVAPAEPQFPDAQSTPAASKPTENIEDIVAALNASYAEVATAPEQVQSSVEVVEVEIFESVVEIEPLQQDEPASEPEPVAAVVSNQTVSEETEPSTPTDLDSEKVQEATDSQSLPTRSGFALSWSWLAVFTSPLSLVLASFIHASGASLAQSVILLASALVLSSLFAAVGAMASTRATNSITTVSRAAFGVWGNALPAVAILFAKLFWTAALVFFASRIISPLIFNQPWFAGVAERLIFPGEFTASLFVLIPMVAVAAVFAAFGGVVLLRLQQLTAVFAVIGVGAFAYFVFSSYSLQDLARGEAIAGSTLIDLGFMVFSLFGFAVFTASGDIARKLPVETPSSKVFFISFVSTLFVPLITGVLGLMWLFMAGDTLGSSFTDEVLATVAGSAPVWVFVLFAVAIGLSLTQLSSAFLYSLSGTFAALVRVPNWVSQLILSVLVLVAVLVPSFSVTASTLQESVAELFILTAVVLAAWSGIFLSDALARTRGYHEVSLTREYGFYGRANVANLFGFVAAVALGFGYVNGGPQLSSWTGYLGDLTPEIFELAGSNIGIVMAFGLAALFPVVLGIPRIRKQESNLAELDQRRQELREFLDAAQ